MTANGYFTLCLVQNTSNVFVMNNVPYMKVRKKSFFFFFYFSFLCTLSKLHLAVEMFHSVARLESILHTFKFSVAIVILFVGLFFFYMNIFERKCFSLLKPRKQCGIQKNSYERCFFQEILWIFFFIYIWFLLKNKIIYFARHTLDFFNLQMYIDI